MRKVASSDDNTSLTGLRDADLLVTQTEETISSSRRSLEFDFDKEIFTSNVYERWIRGSVRKALRKQQSDKPVRHVSLANYRFSAGAKGAGILMPDAPGV